MSRSTTPKPNMVGDEVITSSGLNLSVLQRHDPLIEEILAVASHAVFFQLDSGNEWRHMNVEGSFFVVKRNAPERFQFIIMNRTNTENLVEDILEMREYDIKLPYLTYKNKDDVIRSIFFPNPVFCQDIRKVLDRISTGYGMASPKLKLSTYNSELEQPVVDPTADIIKGLPGVSAVGPKLATENSSLPLPNQGTTALTDQGTIASSISSVGLLNLQFGQLNLQSMLASQTIPPLATPPLSSALHQKCLQYHYPVRPSDFAYVPLDCSLFDVRPHNASSPMNFTSSTAYSDIVNPQGTPLPAPLPPLNPSCPIPDFNLSQNLSNVPSVNKEKIREVLTRLVLNDSFVDMVYQELLRTHHL